LPQDSFSANFLAKYLRLKLLHKFPLNVLVNQLFHNLKKGMYFKDLQGFKLIFSGRFARKERATYKVKFAGRTPLSSAATIVDYGFSQVVLLNSICGIKV
jgi:ribosomal protein S3